MSEQLRDVKGPVYFPESVWPWIILGVVVVVGLCIWLYKVLSKKKQVSVPTREPWDLAYDHLQLLEREGLLKDSRFTEYFVKLSDIARRYLEARFSFRAPEMTTEEFLVSLKQTHHLNERQKEDLKEFLTLCDLVKFAKFQPQIKDGEKGFQLVKKLVDDTKPAVTIESPPIKK